MSRPKAKAAKPALGRPPLPPELLQTAVIRVRCTDAQLAEFEARGGKAWLIRELRRKPRA